MKVKIENFKRVLEKATIGWCADTVHIHITHDKIQSSMMINDSYAVSVINMDNNVVSGMRTDDFFDIYLNEPHKTTLPILSLMGDDEADFQFLDDEDDEKIVIRHNNQEGVIYMCSPEIVPVASRTRPQTSKVQTLLSMPLTELDSYVKKLASVGNRFGKVYFGVKNKKFYIEVTDREAGRFTNSMKFDIMEVEVDMDENLTFCFLFRTLLNAFRVLDVESHYNVEISVKDSSEGVGLIHIGREDDQENYYILSTRENV